MGRYANLGFEIIYDEDGNIKGINFGYSELCEHNENFKGDEIVESTLDKIYFSLQKGSAIDKAFRDEKIKCTSNIRLLKGSDDTYLLTNMLTIDEINQEIKFGKVHMYDEIPLNKIDEIMESIRNHPDKELDNPEFDVSWNEYTFFIISNSENASKILKDLYENIMNNNVALSTNFDDYFCNHGLSFFNLNTLSEKEMMEVIDKKNKKGRKK